MTRKKPSRRKRGGRREFAQADNRATGAAGNAGYAGRVQVPPPANPAADKQRPGTDPRADAISIFGLALLVFACYLPALGGGFIWDDVIFTQEPVVRNWSGLWNIWFSPADIRGEAHYWPIVYTTFWLEHKLYGLQPFGYHLVNVLLHLANSVLLWRLALRLSVPGAWAIAAVFAAHPLHVESVAWVIERKDVLSGLFYLSAALVWVRFTESPNRRRYFAALGLYAAGLLSKSIVVTLPAALLVLQWWRNGRVTAQDAVRLAPFFLVGLAVTAGDLAYYASNERLDFGYSFAERALIAARAVWFYAGKLLWPTELAVIYPHWDVRVGDLLGWAHVAAAAALAALLWRERRRLGRGPLAGALFFLITLSPTLGFIDYGYMQFSFVADRFQYLAGIGLIAVLAGAAAHGAMSLGRGVNLASVGVLAAVLAAYGALSWRHAGIFRDEIAFFSHIVALNPVARAARANLVDALIEADRMEEAYEQSLLAVELDPEAVDAHTALGQTLVVMERFDEAGDSLARALELAPANIIAQTSMADLRRKQGRFEEAAARFGDLLEGDPLNFLAHGGLGSSLQSLGRHEEALASMDRALEIFPASPNLQALHAMSARSLQALGRTEEAAQRFLRAWRLVPENVTPLIDLYVLLNDAGRADEASDHLRGAREAAAGDAAALQQLAEALRGRERHAEAVEIYLAALATDPDFAMAHAGMGDSLFRLERFEEAIASLDRSVELHSEPPTATARLVLMGTAADNLGRPDEAARHYERAVEIDPRDASALDHLAMTRFRDGRYEEAGDLYRVLLDVQESGEAQARTHSNLGAALFFLERYEEALASYERALSIDPNFDSARERAEELRQLLPAGADAAADPAQ